MTIFIRVGTKPGLSYRYLSFFDVTVYQNPKPCPGSFTATPSNYYSITLECSFASINRVGQGLIETYPLQPLQQSCFELSNTAPLRSGVNSVRFLKSVVTTCPHPQTNNTTNQRHHTSCPFQHLHSRSLTTQKTTKETCTRSVSNKIVARMVYSRT